MIEALCIELLALEELLIQKRNDSQSQFNDCVLKVWHMRQRLISENKDRLERERASKLTTEEIAALVGVKNDE